VTDVPFIPEVHTEQSAPTLEPEIAAQVDGQAPE
jgi:hypothetical protein